MALLYLSEAANYAWIFLVIGVIAFLDGAQTPFGKH